MRLIRSGALDPALNLALDEALLRSGTETLRLYAWDPPGLSLGYFQAADEFASVEGFTLVRRPTGGGAIAHTGELTLAYVGRRRPVGEVYASVNAVVAAAALRLGVPALEPGEATPSPASGGLCFDTSTCYDLGTGSGKVFGSAQRRAGNLFLLHGTLVLQKNPLSRGAVSLSELAGRPVSRAEAEEAVIAAATDTWGVRLVAAPPTAAEWTDAHRLVLERYGAESWTKRR